jgi:hypothetical protein
MRPAAWTRATAAPRWIGLLTSAAALCFALGVRADPSAADIASARRLFSEATALREAGQWSEAAAKLREAIAIKETPGLRFHLAHCEEQEGHLLEARDDYDRADALIRQGAAASDVAARLAPARVALRERIPTLVVHAPPDARAVGLEIDGEMIATEQLGSPIQLDPGVHNIMVSAAARDPFRLELTLKEGEDRVVEAQLAERPPAPSKGAPVPPPVPPAAAPKEALQSTEKRGFGLREGILIGEGVVTAAGLGLGVTFLIEANEQSELIARLNASLEGDASACDKPRPQLVPQCSALKQAAIDKHDDQVFALAGMIVAGVGAASLVTTWLLWPTERANQSAHIQIIPAIGGAVVRGAF